MLYVLLVVLCVEVFISTAKLRREAPRLPPGVVDPRLGTLGDYAEPEPEEE